MEIKTEPNFMVSSVEEIKKRVNSAEQRANFTSHNDFWNEMEIK
jgi:hypothetical protein